MWINTYHADINQKNVEVAGLVSEVNFRIRNIIKDKEANLPTIKELSHEETKTIQNVYGSNDRVSKYMEQKLIEIKRKTQKLTIIVK